MYTLITQSQVSRVKNFTNSDYAVIFTALHGMQTRSSDENSVRPSGTRVNCDKTVE